MSSQTIDPIAIRSLFNRLAPRYDLFNRLASLGLDKTWRRRTMEPIREGMRVLDLGCGTGDLCFEASKRVGKSGRVTGLDFSENMLEFAALRLNRAGLNGHSGEIRFVLNKAEDLPIDSEPYDAVVSGFVLRNIYENIDRILAGVFRSLKKGGIIRFLDFTEPDNKLLCSAWRFYMNSVVAFYGAVLFGKDFPFFYMTRSAERFVKPGQFVQKLETAGFKKACATRMMMGSIVLYEAEKQ